MSSRTPLTRAVLETLAYSDIFNYPLKVEELIRFLPLRAKREQVLAALSQLNGQVGSEAGFLFLAGRRELVRSRMHREAASRRPLARALFYGRLLGRLPFVRMVGITGSLAVCNSERSADLDFMLVARAGRVWLARAGALLLNRISRLFGNTLCPNLIVAEPALEWTPRDLYAAREICQMLPVSGAAVYGALRRVNSWTDRFLPNARYSTPSPDSGSTPGRLLQQILEWPLSGRLGDALEKWERQRKIARFKLQAGYGVETVFTADICQGNFDHHGTRTRREFALRLRALGLEDRASVPATELSAPAPSPAVS